MLFVLMELLIRLSGLALMPSEIYSPDEVKLRYPDYEKSGFRDNVDFSETKKDICVIGASVTYGWCIESNDTLVSNLNRNEDLSEDYNFHNLAFPGWNLQKEIDFILENEKMNKFDCDYYLLLFWLGSFMEKFPPISEILVEPDIEDTGCLSQSHLLRVLLKKSHFFRFLSLNYAKIYSSIYSSREIKKKFDVGEFAKDFNRIKDLNKSIIFLKFPLIQKREFVMEFNPIIKSYMGENNFSYFDMSGSIIKNGGAKIRCSKTDPHYNEYGHKLIAEEIGRLLSGNKI